MNHYMLIELRKSLGAKSAGCENQLKSFQQLLKQMERIQYGLLALLHDVFRLNL